MGARVDSARVAPQIRGRSHELAMCRAVLDLIEDGQHAICLTGEAGIGKSRVLNELVDVARARGVRVWVGRGDELEQERPARALCDALDDLAGGDSPVHVADAVRRMREMAPVDRLSAADYFVEVMSAVAAHGPVLLAIENLDWCDEVTLLALRLLARDEPDAPLVVVLTSRSEDVVGATTWPGPFTRVTLGPLMRDEVFAVGEDALGMPLGTRLAAELERAGGNPLFVLELLAALEAEGRIDRGARHAELLSASLPEGFRHIVERRLALLPQATVELLPVAALLGGRFSLSALATVLDKPVALTAFDLGPATATGLLEPDGDELAFRHDLVREVIYRGIPEPVRVALHLDAATRLQQAGASLEQVTPHLLASARGRDPRALDLLVAAAWEQRDIAPSRATGLFEQAMALLEASDPRRSHVLAGMIYPLARSGRMSDAERLARGVLLAPPDDRSAFLAHQGLWLVLLRTGRLEEYRRDVETVLAGGGLMPEQRSLAEARLANVQSLVGESEQADVLAERGADAAAAAGEPGLESLNLSTLTFTRLASGDVSAALATARRSVAVAGRLPRRLQNTQLYLGCALAEADLTRDAIAVLNDGRVHDEAIGDRSVAAVYHWLLGYVSYLTGRWADAAAEVESGLRLGTDDEIAGVSLPIGRATLARIALHTGDETTARAQIDRRAAEIATCGIHAGDELVLWVDAVARQDRGDVEGALDAARQAWAMTRRSRYFMTWRTVVADLVAIAVTAGDEELARAIVAFADEGERRAPDVTSVRAAAFHCRGLLHGDAAALAAAVQLWSLSHRLPNAALAAAHLGSLLAGRGKRDSALTALADAATRFEALGAPVDLSRILRRIEALGAPRRLERTRTGWSSLTDTELEIVTLIQAGLTNRQIGERLFISRYTVDSHLRHVFQKLSVRTRAQLAARASAEWTANHANA